jgi:hypothetical protein
VKAKSAPSPQSSEATDYLDHLLALIFDLKTRIYNGATETAVIMQVGAIIKAAEEYAELHSEPELEPYTEGE